MGGGLMQLVAYGAQDMYLTGNPQITFFKVVYRRHTNFSMETIEQQIPGSNKVSEGINSFSDGNVIIARNGDLIHKIYVRGDSPDYEVITGAVSAIKEVTIEIGGQKIDKHTSEWLKVWNELTIDKSKSRAFKCMTGESGRWGNNKYISTKMHKT